MRSLRDDGRTRPWRRDFPLDAVSIHVPLEGACHIAVDTPIWTHRLERGEILVVNRGIGGAVLARDEGEPPQVVSARVEFEAPHGHPLLEGLPDLIQAGPTGGADPDPSAHSSTHSSRRGAAARGLGMIALRFFEALFVQALRCHLLDVNWNDRGWFRVLADPVLSPSPGPGASDSGGVQSVTELSAFGESIPAAVQRPVSRAGRDHPFRPPPADPCTASGSTPARRRDRSGKDRPRDGLPKPPELLSCLQARARSVPGRVLAERSSAAVSAAPDGPEKTRWEAEAAYRCPDMWELRFALEEQDVADSDERAHPSKPE